MTQAMSKPPLWRVFALIYVLLPLIAYPTVLLIAQDFPHLPTLSLRRYFEPAVLPHFRFEAAVLRWGFVFMYILGFGLLFAKEGKWQFIASATILSAVAYEVTAYFFVDYFGVDSQGHLPPLIQGGVMLLAIALATHISESLVFYFCSRKAFGPRSAGFRGLAVFLIGICLIVPIVLYPLVMILAETFPDFSQMRAHRVFEATQIPFFSHRAQLLLLGSVAAYFALVTLLLVRIKRVQFFVAASMLSYVLYNLGVYVQIYADVSLDAVRMRPDVCGSTDLSACLTFAEHGWIFTLSAVASALIIERSFKHFGQLSLYRLY